MEKLKQEIIELMNQFTETSYGKGSCGELGDSYQAIDGSDIPEIAYEITKIIKESNKPQEAVPSYGNMKELFEALYASEINIQLSWFWDTGYTIKIGDDMNGFNSIIESHDLDECLDKLVKKAKELYPDSKFSKNHKNKTDFDKAVEPAIRYLFKNHHPHTRIYINYDSAELLIGERVHNLTSEVPD